MAMTHILPRWLIDRKNYIPSAKVNDRNFHCFSSRHPHNNEHAWITHYVSVCHRRLFISSTRMHWLSSSRWSVGLRCCHPTYATGTERLSKFNWLGTFASCSLSLYYDYRKHITDLYRNNLVDTRLENSWIDYINLFWTMKHNCAHVLTFLQTYRVTS
jgi:hypothetical protein